MVEFKYSQEPDPQWDDRCFLTVDQRYTMAIVRTHNGLSIDIWPINGGKVWDMPCRMIQILDGDTAVEASLDLLESVIRQATGGAS